MIPKLNLDGLGHITNKCKRAAFVLLHPNFNDCNVPMLRI